MKKLLAIWVSMVAALMSFHQAQGQVLVSGNVYEQDSISAISGATVVFSGIDMLGDTVIYQFVTDTLGYYEDSINYGLYKISACAEGYDCSYLADSLLIECDSLQFDSLVVVYDSLTGIYDSIYMVYDSLTGQYDTVYFDTDTIISGINLVLYEIRYPVRYVIASPYTGDLVRICWSMYDSLRYEDREKTLRTFRYFELFRRRIDGSPVLMASHLTDTVFVDANWSSLPWGQYCWGVSCCYEGNRYASDTIWSAFLDKDMTTTLEVNITTNVGLPAANAVVTLSSHDGQGHTYQDEADADGHLLMTDVYRGLYDIHIHLDGFMDYVSAEPLSIMEPQQAQVELMEALYAIDSLYVSYTGYAIWHLSDIPSRDLQYYELRLNGQMVGSTTETSFQFDVNGLSPGQTYLVEVRPVFLSETCNWHSLDWVFWPCAYFQGSENGLQWMLTEDAVQLSWDNPEGATILGAFLYRDGEYLGFIEDNAFLDETVTMHGEVSYCMHLLYGGPTDGTYYSESCEECVVVSFPNYCDPPMKLKGENYWNSDLDYGALISWGERPEPIYQWLYYDNGEYKRSLGGDNEPIIFWSIRFDAADLESYAGSSLKKVSLYDVGAGVYQLWIYVGGETAPRTLVWSQNMTLCNAHAWHEENLNLPIVIPENEPLWIVVGQQGLNRPAAACADMGNPNGRWVSLDGEHWTDMNTFNMHYTWMLRAYVTNRSGRVQPLDEGGYALQHYNLYRSYDNADYEQVAMIPAVEGQAFYQYRDVLVDNEHGSFYYRLSASYLSADGETCESDFAISLYTPDVNYVFVDDHWGTGEREEASLKLYPNPSNGQITIEQEGIQKVVVYNALGQLLLDKEIAGDVVQLDLSGVGNGLYWVRVMSQSGMVMRRFVLSR